MDELKAICVELMDELKLPREYRKSAMEHGGVYELRVVGPDKNGHPVVMAAVRVQKERFSLINKAAPAGRMEIHDSFYLYEDPSSIDRLQMRLLELLKRQP